MSLKYAKPEKRERLQKLYNAIHAGDYAKCQELTAEKDAQNRMRIYEREIIGPQEVLDMHAVPNQARMVVYDQKLKKWFVSLVECQEFYGYKSYARVYSKDWFVCYNVVNIYRLDGLTGDIHVLSKKLNISLSAVKRACSNGRRGKLVRREIIERPFQN